MPTEQGIGLHEEPMELPSGDQPAEAGKECSIRGPQGRAVDLATEDRHLVTEHDDFDGQIGLVGSSPAEEFDGPEEGEIEKREGHGPCSRSHPLRRKSQLNGSDEILGTHRRTRALDQWLPGQLPPGSPLVTGGPGSDPPTAA